MREHTLDERVLALLMVRYGIGESRRLTQRRAAEVMGLDFRTVRHLEARAIAELHEKVGPLVARLMEGMGSAERNTTGDTGSIQG